MFSKISVFATRREETLGYIINFKLRRYRSIQVDSVQRSTTGTWRQPGRENTNANMLRLCPPEFSSAAEKVNKIYQELIISFDVQKTILNESSVCFQIELRSESTEVSYLWQFCKDLAERLRFRCYLTLTRSRRIAVPNLQIIVDTEDLQRTNDHCDIHDKCFAESVFGENNYSFYVPGSTMIKCILPLDDDGILDLGQVLDDASVLWGQRCTNVSLFGNAEDEDGFQTIYITIANEEDDGETEMSAVTSDNANDERSQNDDVDDEANHLTVKKVTRSQSSMTCFSPYTNQREESFFHKLKRNAINGSALFLLTGLVVPLLHGYLNFDNGAKT